MGLIARHGHITLTTSELPTDDSDMVTKAKWFRGEGDRAFGMVKHELEHFHLTVRNDSEGMPAEIIGVTSLVGQEVVDVGQFDDFPTFTFSDVDEEKAGDEHSLHLLLLSCTPDTCLQLGCHIGFITKSRQSLTTSLLRVSAHNGNKPLAVWYAYGVVNFRSWRNLRIH